MKLFSYRVHRITQTVCSAEKVFNGKQYLKYGCMFLLGPYNKLVSSAAITPFRR